MTITSEAIHQVDDIHSTKIGIAVLLPDRTPAPIEITDQLFDVACDLVRECARRFFPEWSS